MAQMVNEAVDSRYKKESEQLRQQLAYYKQENARLKMQNETLHETAWELIRRLRAMEKSELCVADKPQAG